MKNYKDRAELILKDAIKSAIYIDDKAREFYAEEKSGALEEQLSIDLFRNFKQQGISLDVHKFNPGDETNGDLIRYFTDNRDLVLLDWKLNGQGGERESLTLLNKVVEASHIHFCAIYTSESEKELDNILLNILSFFSGKTKEDYEKIREKLELEELPSDVVDVLNKINLNRFNKEEYTPYLRFLFKKENKDITNQIKEITGETDPICASVITSLALYNKEQSDKPLGCPSYIDADRKILVINNTVITILNKDENKADVLFDKYSNQIVEEIDCFNKLLGLELHNKLFKTSAIWNDPFISFSKNSLLYHRRNLRKEKIEFYFSSFMNEVILEKLDLSLRDKTLSLLEDEFLNDLEGDIPSNLPIEDLQKINIFYNCLKLDKKGKTLNFGDVFEIKHVEGRHQNSPKYLICITPLCDCLRPQDNIKSNFYFAEGSNIALNDALHLGDTAFISFLPENKTIKWSCVASNQLAQKYGALYIKPVQYKVLERENTINDNNEIEVHYLDKQGIKQTETLIYLGTIRQHYAQRIANHAFSHPMRVGIDFVKMQSDNAGINTD